MKQHRFSRLLAVGLLALVATIGFDLFLHAGILAKLYSTDSPFLLSSEQAFRRIPLGYLSFAILTGLLLWLMVMIRIRGWRRGLAFGAAFGALAWGSLTLGLYSIATASPELLIGWFLGQTVELGVAGMVVGSGLGANRVRPLLVRVLIFFLLTLVLAIVLQNILVSAA